MRAIPAPDQPVAAKRNHTILERLNLGERNIVCTLGDALHSNMLLSGAEAETNMYPNTPRDTPVVIESLWEKKPGIRNLCKWDFLNDQIEEEPF